MRRTLYEAEYEAFRESFRRFLDADVVPHHEEWESAGIVPRELYTTAGKSGFLGMNIPEEYGGGGVADFRFNAVIAEKVMRCGAAAAGLWPDPAQRHLPALLPRLCQRRAEAALAARHRVRRSDHRHRDDRAGTGSDLASIATVAHRDGDGYVVNGAKTFITNGTNADLMITAVKTDPTRQRKGVRLLVLERGMPGFERGCNLDKLGQHAQDTAELSFTDARVPMANLLGPEEGQGFTPDSRFVLAEIATEVDIAEHYVDDCVRALNAGELTAVDDCVRALNAGELTAVDASKAKRWCTELQGRVVDR